MGFVQALDSVHSKMNSGAATPAALMELAMLFHANLFLKEAKICYRFLEEREPEEPRWPYLLALINLDQGDVAKGRVYLEKAIALKSDYLPALLKLGDVLFKLDDSQGAVEAYEGCLILVPGLPQAVFGLIRERLREGDEEEVLVMLSDLLEEVPDFGPGHTLMAQLRQRSDDSKGAEKSRLEGKKWGRYPEPHDPWLEEMMSRCYDVHRLTVLADVHVTTGEFERALELFDRAQALAPDSATVPFIRGLRLAEIGDSIAAIESFEVALRLGGDTEGTFAELVKLHMKLKEFAKATAVARRGLEAHPKSVLLRTVLGELLLREGEAKQAEGHLRAALQIDPHRPRAIRHLGEALWEQGRKSEALEQFRELRRLSPVDVHARTFLARHHAGQGDFAQAEILLREARALRPEEPQLRRLMLEFLQKYGSKLAQEGHFAEAARYFREALEINPDWTDLRRDLALIYANAEDWDAAEESLTVYLDRRPGDIAAWLLYGDLCWSGENHLRARRYWRKAQSMARRARRADLLSGLEARLNRPIP